MSSPEKSSRFIRLALITGISASALTGCDLGGSSTSAYCDTSHLRHTTDKETYWDYAYDIGPASTGEQQQAVADALAKLNHAPADKSVELGAKIILPGPGDCHIGKAPAQ